MFKPRSLTFLLGVLLAGVLLFIQSLGYCQSSFSEDLGLARQKAATEPEGALVMFRDIYEQSSLEFDTTAMRNAMYFSARIYMERGQIDSAYLTYRRSTELSIPYGLRLDEPYGNHFEPYHWQFNGWESCLEIAIDSSGKSLEEAVSGHYQMNNPTKFSIDNNYWVRTILRGGQIGEIYQFSIGDGVFSWDTVDIYYQDSLYAWQHLRTGLSLKASEKCQSDAFNFFSIPLERSITQLYIRLAHANTNHPPTNIILNHHDINSDIERFGYRSPGFHNDSEDGRYEFTMIQRSLEILECTEDQSFIEIVENWSRLLSKNKDFIPNDKTCDYWVRFFDIGTTSDIGTRYFMIGDEGASWPKIDIYVSNHDTDDYTHFKSGYLTRKSVKPVSNGLNIFPIHTAIGDTTEIFLKLTGGTQRYIPDGITLYHIDFLQMNKFLGNRMIINSLIHGAIWLQTFFFFGLFLMEKDRSHLYYSIFLLSTSVFFLSLDPHYFLQIWPKGMNVRAVIHLISQFFIAFGLWNYYKHYMDIRHSAKRVCALGNGIVIMLGALVLIEFVLFVGDDGFDVYDSLTWLTQLKLIIFIVLFALIIYSLIAFVRKGNRQSIYFLIGISTIALTAFWLLGTSLSGADVLLDLSSIVFLLGMIISMTLFSLGSGYRTKKLKSDRQNALQKEFETTQGFLLASEKFVPEAFVKALGKQDIREVKLGDYVERDVSVMFADVRGFTTMSESLSPEEAFEFVQRLNRLMGPIISSFDGFINTYLGDGVMAIFPNSADEAFRASVQIQQALEEMQLKVNLGIGLHFGPLILGIVGDQQRMAATTISDTVNTAARLESLTKEYHTNILVSDQIYHQLSPDDQQNLEYIGERNVKGKSKPITIYGFTNH